MKLKPGVEIIHKRKKYSGEIPDAVFQELYGSDKKKSAHFKKKFEFLESKQESNES